MPAWLAQLKWAPLGRGSEARLCPQRGSKVIAGNSWLWWKKFRPSRGTSVSYCMRKRTPQKECLTVGELIGGFGVQSKSPMMGSVSEPRTCLGGCFLWENRALPLKTLQKWQIFINLHNIFLVFPSKALRYLQCGEANHFPLMVQLHSWALLSSLARSHQN